MSDSERVKGLLDGSMDPAELEGDDELYALAERIYGREALEEMGVSIPEYPAENIPQLFQNGDDMDVELPEIEDSVADIDAGPRGTRQRKLVFLVGLIGMSLVGMNVAIGIGQYFDLCVDDLEPDPLGFTVTANEQNGSLYITWTVTNLNVSANYSIQWSISQNGLVKWLMVVISIGRAIYNKVLWLILNIARSQHLLGATLLHYMKMV